MPQEDCIDVLVIGAGPAGLMCANALAMAGTNVRIIDIRPVKVATGQADGITPRTIEVLQSYGLAERLICEGCQIHMAAFYSSGRNGQIECTGRKPVVTVPTARYPFLIGLKQAAVESLFLDSLKDHGIEVERPRRPSSLEISEDSDELSSPLSHAVRVTVERLDAVDEENKTEVIRAKFVIGADGAHSWVRKNLGIEMEGEQTENIWGVIDVTLETDFPDIRNIATIHSEKGTCFIAPREGDGNRLYIQLSDADVVNPLTGGVDKDRMSSRKLLSMARQIMHPYALTDPKDIEWWTVYIVDQRVASSYSLKDRVFLAGDACHTHLPQAGQGMNASINDAHNLAWKLVQVLRGRSSPSLLKTYEHERRKFAKDLIKFDKHYSALRSTKPRTAENENGISHDALSRALQTSDGFISGIGIQYTPSAIVDPKHQKCAQTLVIGKRMHPQIFVRAADIHPVDIQDLLPADVRFKVLIFVGKLTSTRVDELNLLAGELDKPSSFFHGYGANNNISSSVFEIITIIAGKKGDVNHLLVPVFFRPQWSKVLLDDTDVTESEGGDAYERFGIDPEQITFVVVRPDGYVGTIVPSTAIADLHDYFDSFMVPHRGGFQRSGDQNPETF